MRSPKAHGVVETPGPVVLWRLLPVLAATLASGVAAQPEPGQGDDATATGVDPALSPEQVELVETGEALEAAFREAIAKFDEESAELKGLEGEAALVQSRLVLRSADEALTRLGAWVDNLGAQEANGLDASEMRTRVETEMLGIDRLVPPAIARRGREITTLRAKLSRAPFDDDLDETSVAEELTFARDRFLTTAEAIRAHLERMRMLALDADTTEEAFREALTRAAEVSAERIALDVERAELLGSRAREPSGGEEMASRLGVIRSRVAVESEFLRALVRVMEAEGLDTSTYRADLFLRTGELTTDLFDRNVAASLTERWLSAVKTWATVDAPRFVLNVVVVLLMLLLGRLVAAAASRLVRVSLGRARRPRVLQETSAKIVAGLVMIAALIVALSVVGIDVGTLLAGVGIAGFVVGFALQDSLANLFAGVMIAGNRPFDVGDVIDAGGGSGKVAEMTLLTTTLLTFDNQTVVIPNRKVWGELIRNYTAQAIRRVDMVFQISYQADLPRAEEALMRMLAEDPRVLETPAPMVQGNTLRESTVEVMVRPWVNTSDYWGVLWDLTREGKLVLDQIGIPVQVPRRDVVLRQTAEGAEARADRDATRDADPSSGVAAEGVSPPRGAG